MTIPVQPVDALDQIFGNPVVKAVLAAISVYAAIVKYIKDAGDRRARAASIAKRFGFTGPIFWIINRAPHLFHHGVALSVLMLASIEIAVLVDRFGLDNAVISSLPVLVQNLANSLSSHFVALFLLALGLYVIFELRVLEHCLAWLVGLVPTWRRNIEWANASWQINADEKDRKVLARSAPDIENAATRLIDELVSQARNDSLALRPPALSPDSAGNVLYFGHVFEACLAARGSRYASWTSFYSAMGQVAETDAAPFSPEAINAFDEKRSFLDVLRQANTYLDPADQISNDAGLEHAVEIAFRILRGLWTGDARNIAKGVFGTAYGRLLSGAKSFLDDEGMRRQFAKLFIIWNIVPNATRPAVFRIPFNTNMFVRYLDDGVIRSEGPSFDFTTENVEICFEEVEREILTQILTFLNSTKDKKRSDWRTAEQKDIEDRGIDWAWWVYYRADQQAYSGARKYTSTKWKSVANQEIVKL